MKIVSQTADEMVLKDNNIISKSIWGVILVGSGGFVLYLNHINLIALFVGGAFVIVGLISILFAVSITVIIQKGRGQFLFQDKGLIKNQSRAYNIADVIRIEMRNDYQMQTSSMQGRIYSRPVMIYQSVIVMKDGIEIPLESIKTPGQLGISSMTVLRGGESKEISIGQQVVTFMGVPFQEIGAPNPGIGIDINPRQYPPGSGGMQL
jgi:hypothetical protein